MSTALDFITIAQAARLIAARELSPVELLEAKLARIGACDGQINAFITLTAEHALRQAKAAQADIAAGKHRGPLHGIPFGLKDIYATAGILTSGHSRSAMNHIPREDAAVTAKLYAAGGVLVGKLATCEFAHGPWPPARNPWNTAHFTGGSSTGAGAAVAAGFLPIAMGTDTGGSVRNPAACCGTVGLKPTYGLVSRYGVIPNSWSFDHCGPLAWTVEDCAIVLDAIAGFDERDSGSARCEVPDYRAALGEDIRGLRIGVIRHFWEEDLQVAPEVAQAMERAIELLRNLGATLEDARMAPLQDYLDVKMTIAETEIFCVHQRQITERPNEFGLQFLAQTLAGCLFDASDYVQSQRARRRLLARMTPLYEKYDVLLTVSSAPAPRFDKQSILRSWLGPNIHTAFSVTGGPSIVVCNGFAASGLPLAMQIAGRPFDDAKVLRVAHAYEQAAQWRGRRPSLQPGAAPAAVTPPPALSGAAIDESIRAEVAIRARRAGLKLDDMQFALLSEIAPHAFKMAERIRRDFDRSEEPASGFRFAD